MAAGIITSHIGYITEVSYQISWTHLQLPVSALFLPVHLLRLPVRTATKNSASNKHRKRALLGQPGVSANTSKGPASIRCQHRTEACLQHVSSQVFLSNGDHRARVRVSANRGGKRSRRSTVGVTKTSASGHGIRRNGSQEADQSKQSAWKAESMRQSKRRESQGDT